MANAIRILGLDPGLRRTGWGVVAVEGARLSWIAHGVIAPHEKLAFAERLLCLFEGICEVIADDACAKSDRRTPSSIFAVSSASQIAGISSRRSTATNAAAMSPSAQPSSSTSSNGWTIPMRLMMRFAILVAMISRRS